MFSVDSGFSICQDCIFYPLGKGANFQDLFYLWFWSSYRRIGVFQWLPGVPATNNWYVFVSKLPKPKRLCYCVLNISIHVSSKPYVYIFYYSVASIKPIGVDFLCDFVLKMYIVMGRKHIFASWMRQRLREPAPQTPKTMFGVRLGSATWPSESVERGTWFSEVYYMIVHEMFMNVFSLY